MAASAELLRHVALRRAASDMARTIMDGEYEDDIGEVIPNEPAASKQAAKTTLSVVTKSEHESNMEWLRKSMSNTKESIWAQIQDAAAKDPATNGMGITAEQAQAKFLGTPAGNKLYEAWTKAPWDPDSQGSGQSSATSYSKAENMGAPRGSSKVTRSAADEAALIQMGIEAEASLKR